MRRYFERREAQREELEELMKAPANVRLKRIALGVIAIGIALQMIMIFLIDKISWKLLMVMRGCVGVSAIVFVVLVATLLYRVHSANLKQRGTKRK